MRIWVLLVACGAVCALVGACGGEVSGGPDAGGDAHASSGNSASGSGGSTSGSGSGMPIPLCPPDPPAVEVACASPGQGCAYMIGGQCEGYRCTSDSGWKLDPTVTCP